jgi:hypothetical protein
MLSEALLLLSSFVNMAIGFYLAFFSTQPPVHLTFQATLGSSRLAYVEYVFKAHGFLVAQIGMASLFAVVVLRSPGAKCLAAFQTFIGDAYFAFSVWSVLQSPAYVPTDAEPEMAMVSVYWALLEAILMGVVFLSNYNQSAKKIKKQ